MLVDIVMPKMGESLTEGTILKWHKQLGDKIGKDEIFLEIGTDKVDSEIPSPVAGTLVEILAELNDVVEVETVIARIETDTDAKVKILPEPEEKVTVKKPPVLAPEPQRLSVSVTQPTATGEKRFFTPVVNKIAAKAGISMTELTTVPGSGKGGRVTKQDILAYLNQRKPVSDMGAPEQPAVRPAGLPTSIFAGGQERVEMSHMRKLIAEHMRKSLDTSAHVFVMTEVDMSPIVEFVEQNGVAFYEREGFKLTYTPFIVQAVVKALQAFPEMNAALDGTTILRNRNVNIGLAVAVENGLMVPVIPNCEELNFLGLCRKVTSLAQRTRNKEISPDELQGSTFSITNFGVFGVTVGMPIINQPNVGILGIGAVKKRPVVIETSGGDSIGIKNMMFLSLGFDHRLVDGAGGSRFIQAVKVNLESINLNSLF